MPDHLRQPDPTPPEPEASSDPSLLLYGAILLAALILTAAAFLLESRFDWPALLLNLATELVGAVAILLIIDRRLRAEDRTALRSYAEVLSEGLERRFSSPAHRAHRYGEIVCARLLAIKPGQYVPRPEYDSLLNGDARGFLLCGPAGSGKSTVAQRLAYHLADKLRAGPERGPVPVFLTGQGWNHRELVQELFDVLNSYFPVSRGLFWRWLKGGRLVAILDGLDSHSNPGWALDAVDRFARAYPRVRLVVTARRALLCCDLPVVELSGISPEQARRLFMTAGLPESTWQMFFDDPATRGMLEHPISLRLIVGALLAADDPARVLEAIRARLLETESADELDAPLIDELRALFAATGDAAELVSRAQALYGPAHPVTRKLAELLEEMAQVRLDARQR
jgi:hypothetical protein